MQFRTSRYDVIASVANRCKTDQVKIAHSLIGHLFVQQVKW